MALFGVIFVLIFLNSLRQIHLAKPIGAAARAAMWGEGAEGKVADNAARRGVPVNRLLYGCYD